MTGINSSQKNLGSLLAHMTDCIDKHVFLTLLVPGHQKLLWANNKDLEISYSLPLSQLKAQNKEPMNSIGAMKILAVSYSGLKKKAFIPISKKR